MDKKQFADWLTHLGVCTGRPVDRAVLTSYYLELKDRLTEDELAEAVRLLVANWTDIGFPKVYHIIQAARKTKARRARQAARLIRRLDLEGYDLTAINVRRYVAWRISDELEDTELARASLGCALDALRGPEGAQVLLAALDRPLPALPAAPPDRGLPRQLTTGIGDARIKTETS